MIIGLKKFGTALISRQTGKEAFAALQPLLKDISAQEDVVVDFDGIITFSPSWGDEFLTPLVKNYGARFKLMHTDNPSVHTTIEILEKSEKVKFNFIN